MTDPGIERRPADDGLRPVPDPTLLTTQQLIRELSSLKELVFTRIDAVDRALILLQEAIDRRPVEVDRQIDHVKELVAETFKLHEERFNSIQVRFQERDMRSEQGARDAKSAIDTALEAAEKSVAKSEGSTVKQIDQLQFLLQSATSGLDGKINDIKDRITIIEGKTIGQATAHETRDTSQTQWVGIISLVMGGFLGIAGLAVAMISQPDKTPVVERVVVDPLLPPTAGLR